MQTIVIGVAGGSGSGKTTVALNLLKLVGDNQVAYLSHDFYYKDAGHLPLNERQKLNCDHPDAFDNDLLVEHLNQLKQGQDVAVPIYDFKTYLRQQETQVLQAQRVILIDGILIFADKRLRNLMDVKIFVDTDADIRFIRRLQRDIMERGRSTELVVEQYLNTVRPMHLEFVEPSKRYADIIVPEGGFNEVATQMIASRIKALLNKNT